MFSHSTENNHKHKIKEYKYGIIKDEIRTYILG